ncbi:FecR family protein [Variovorax arabinosiphilus]|uniref:FecR family protein n=1 Tax=Variovorax arabinosiphilus TaxID=3053498 RepID=UPI002577B01F|nr:MULTISPECIES: FecR domain-containing protein [unclassified Variovorax]MDM0122401.1 FecR domain-containing protein [Variovorax sp. J2L1-78]MDM0131070.1 FecR domain-containing protein [Variovorax sp. J2L1-63]MDM0235164.1 FecR domain-containing protein [Variovorax sp. J2R1-6]
MLHAQPSRPPSPSDIDGEALDWFVRRGAGLDADEEALFQIWRARSAAHATAFARWQGEWRALDALPAEGIARLRRDLAIDKAREDEKARPIRQGVPTARRRWRGMAAEVPRFALALAVLCVGVAGVRGWAYWQRQPVYAAQFETQRGQQREIDLPDGSRLRLDTATRIDVALYRQRREVRLPEGQALFQVHGDASRPFDVVAGSLRITVVGTRFSVRHTPGVPGERGVRVAVEEGRVRVARSGPDAPVSGGRTGTGTIELHAGQQVAIDADGTLGPVVPVAGAGIAPWRDGRVSFDDVPLAQALAEFERYGPTGLVFGDAAAASLRLTGTFDPRRLDNFLRLLPTVLPVQLQARGDATEILSRRTP